MGRWLRVVPMAHAKGWLAWVRHDESRCMIVHQPCPGPDCEFWRRSFAGTLRRSIELAKLDHMWERAEAAIERSKATKT